MRCNVCMVLWLAAAMGISGFVQETARGAIIAQDDFESYTDGAPIVGESGGSGWTDAWSTSGSATDPVRLVTSGVIPGFGQSLEISGAGAQNLLARSFAPQTDTVYIGMVMRTNDWSDAFFAVYGNNTITSSANDSFTAGIENSTDNFYFVRKGSSSNTTNATLAHTGNVTHTLVMKFSKSSPGELNNYDQIALWIDQATEGTPTAMRDESLNSNTAMGATLGVIHLRTNTNTTQRVYLDALKVGTTYAEVVPEPSGILLAIFACIGLWCRRVWRFRPRCA